MKEQEEELENYKAITLNKYQNRDVAKKYLEEYEGKLRLKNFHQKIISAREISIIESLLNIATQSGSQVLDLPCGTGKLAQVFKRKKLTVVGADISKEMLDIAKNKYENYNKLKELIRVDATKMPFADNSFDTVVCLRLLHRVPTKIKRDIISECSRVTREYLIISFGKSSLWQNFRVKIREKIYKQRSVPYPLSGKIMSEIIKKNNCKIIKKRKVLPFFSAEYIYLLRKIN